MSLKQCTQCPTMFLPRTSLQLVCSPACSIKLAKSLKAQRKANQQAERRRDKARKEAIKTIPWLIREAQIAFNTYIRLRDHRQPCISCGKPPGDMSELHAGRDAGHYRSTGSASHLRFDEDNVHAQCVACNRYGAGRAVDYRIGLIKRIGVKRVEALETNNTPHKWTREELTEIRETYRQRGRWLRDFQEATA